MGRHVQVVEADHAQVVGHAQPHFARRPHDTDRHHVAHGQDRGRPKLVLPDTAERSHAAIEGGGAHDDSLVAESEPAERQPLAVTGQAARCHRLGRPGRVLEQPGHVRRLDTDHDEFTMAERKKVPGGRSGAHLVVRFDRSVLGERVAVDEDHRQPGPPNLLDFGVVLAQTDGHEPIDGGPAERPHERAA